MNNLFSIERTLFLDDGAEIPIKPLHYTMLQSSLWLSVSLAFSGTAKNNAIKALLSDYVPSEPGNPGMQ